MKILIKGFIALNLLVVSAFKQENACNELHWTKSLKLTWNDFKAQPDNNSKDGAMTSSGFNFDSYTIKGNSDTVTLNVKSYFICNASWVKEYAKINSVLKHEQCHFDINELFARKFRQQLSSYKFRRSSFKTTLKELLAKKESERTAYQTLYDKETDHSKIAIKQTEWEKKVAKELKSLDAFSETKLKLYLAK